MSSFLSALVGLFQRGPAADDTPQPVNVNDPRRVQDVGLAEIAKNEAQEEAQVGSEAKSEESLADGKRKRHAIEEDQQRLRKSAKTNRSPSSSSPPPHDMSHDGKQALPKFDGADDDLDRKAAALPTNLKPVEHMAREPCRAASTTNKSSQVVVTHQYNLRSTCRLQEAAETHDVQHLSNAEGDVQSYDGIWDIVAKVSRDRNPLQCRMTGCTSKAVAIWASNMQPDDKWPLCESCQVDEFGGWPEEE